jgi:uncharacterized integral membrane protein
VGRIFTSFLLLLVLLLVLGVAVLNPTPRISVNLLFGTFQDVPLVLALFVAFLLGSLITFLYLIGHSLRLRWKIRDLKGRIRQYERELIELRNIPVEGREGERETPIDLEDEEASGR